MLRLVFRLILPLTLVCAALIAVAPYVDQPALPPSAEWDAYGFGACDLPCWGGITIGQTSFARTLPALRANVSAFTEFANVPAQMLIYGKQSPYEFSGMIMYLQQRVDSISLNLRLPLDRFIDALGAPDCVIYADTAPPNREGGWLMWDHGDTPIGVLVYGRTVQLRTPALTVYAVQIGAALGDGICEHAPVNPVAWRGIAPFWRYQEWSATP